MGLPRGFIFSGPNGRKRNREPSNAQVEKGGPGCQKPENLSGRKDTKRGLGGLTGQGDHEEGRF